MINIPPTDGDDRMNRKNLRLNKKGHAHAAPKKRYHEIEFDQRKAQGLITEDYRLESLGSYNLELPDTRIVPKRRRKKKAVSPAGRNMGGF